MNRSYNNSVNPAFRSAGSSATIRAEFDAIDAGFTAIEAEIDLKASALSPALTGVPTAPTAAPGTNTTQIANTAFVTTATTAATAAAAASAAAAAATAATAATWVPVPVWVSGATYAIGDSVYSPLNYLTYRRITAGAGTTDPSVDPTNWNSVISGSLPDYLLFRTGII